MAALSLQASRPLEIVQVDHTQADVFVVDRFTRRTLGRPWLSVAIDVSTRCILAIYLGMGRPNAATVALLVSRIVLPKEGWLKTLEVEADWPMHGIPKTLHLDNAAEFRGRALRLGCAEYGIELDYRPVGRPHYGGHIERLNRTLMQRLQGLPGATGNSPKGRKASKPEAKASLTLGELERWLAMEISQRYHHSEHRGLHGATPTSAWLARADGSVRTLAPGADASLHFLIHFMPVVPRTIQADGLTLFYIRYWHPIFAAWRETRRAVRVRYHPEDLSCVFVSVDGKSCIRATYADTRRPAISLWEQRAAVKALREQGNPKASEHHTWGLLRDSVTLALDAVPAGIDIEKVRGYLASVAGVSEVHDLHVWGMSTTETALTAHLVIPSVVSQRQTIASSLFLVMTRGVSIWSAYTLLMFNRSVEAAAEPVSLSTATGVRPM